MEVCLSFPHDAVVVPILRDKIESGRLSQGEFRAALENAGAPLSAKEVRLGSAYLKRENDVKGPYTVW